jgi:hypothetical protein
VARRLRVSPATLTLAEAPAGLLLRFASPRTDFAANSGSGRIGEHEPGDSEQPSCLNVRRNARVALSRLLHLPSDGVVSLTNHAVSVSIRS